MSIVFNARRHAEESRRAKIANTEPSQLPATEEVCAELWSAGQSPSVTVPDAALLSNKLGGGLDLRAERCVSGWRLRWNHDVVLNALHGSMLISDGDVHKRLNLDSDELRTGKIVYSPLTDEVVFLLEIVSAPSGDPIRESIRVVSGTTPTLRLPIKMSSPGVPIPTAAPISRSDAKWADGVGIAKSPADPQSPLVRSLLRMPRCAAATKSSALVQGSGTIEPANLIAHKEPVYPAIARQSLISGSVEVHFCISAGGKVYAAKSVSGSPILARAAIEAVEAWCYEPARLNGRPIDSRGRTKFDFKLN